MYIVPDGVTSPRSNWCLSKVLANTGDGGWSVAEGTWDGEACLAMRWNGSANTEGVGNPQSRGYPTWFVIPEIFREVILSRFPDLSDGLSCEITQPEGYYYGAWKITAVLSPAVKQRLNNGELAFPLPALPHRLCIPEATCRIADAEGLKGYFREGLWSADLYSNGIVEDRNPTKIPDFREALIQNISRSISAASASV